LRLFDRPVTGIASLTIPKKTEKPSHFLIASRQTGAYDDFNEWGFSARPTQSKG
jgi:hypothetical protein